jgi:hypothetical protein
LDTEKVKTTYILAKCFGDFAGDFLFFLGQFGAVSDFFAVGVSFDMAIDSRRSEKESG